MQKFDLSAAWDDVKRLLGAHPSLVWAVAGVFLFLPQLLVSLVTPAQDPAATSALPVEQQLALMQDGLWQILPYALIAGIISSVGNAAILRLWLSRTEISVSDAIKTGLGLVVTIFFIQLLSGVGAFFGFLLLIIPGIYLSIRWMVATAYAVDMNERNPIAAMRESWRLTKGNVLSIFFFIFLLAIALVVVVMLASLVASLFLFLPAVGPFLVLAINGILTTIATVVILAALAAVYRQLVVINSASATHDPLG